MYNINETTSMHPEYCPCIWEENSCFSNCICNKRIFRSSKDGRTFSSGPNKLYLRSRMMNNIGFKQ